MHKLGLDALFPTFPLEVFASSQLPLPEPQLASRQSRALLTGRRWRAAEGLAPV